MMQKKNFVGWLFLLLLMISPMIVIGQSYTDREATWIQDKIRQLTLDQKIGQIFMVSSYAGGHVQDENLIESYIKKYHIGGICFYQGTRSDQFSHVNKYQKISAVPMFIGIDSEWGLALKFPNETVSFPKQMMLGAIKNEKLIYTLGREIGQQCKRAGININFASSIDVSNDPKKSVIFDRSFGDAPENVVQKGHMFIKAMEDEGILIYPKRTSADTNVGSILDLPTSQFNPDRHQSMELYPFMRLSNLGIGPLIIGHFKIPKLDTQTTKATTLSTNITQRLLRESVRYNELRICDSMGAKGVNMSLADGIAEAEAFMTGNDVILVSENLPLAFNKIKEYIASGKISVKRLDQSVERILRAKYKVGLNHFIPDRTDSFHDIPKRNYSLSLKQKLIESAMTLVSDRESLIPIMETSGQKIGTLSINNVQQTKFQQRISDFCEARHYQMMPAKPSNYSQMLQILKQFDKVIVGIHTSGKMKDFSSDLSDDMIQFFKNLQSHNNVIFVLFGSPYLLEKLDFAHHVLLSYDNDPLTQDVAAQSLFGVNHIIGSLPVTVNDRWAVGSGLERLPLGRLGYALPEMVHMSSDTLNKIDSIMDEVIRLKASPGGQILIAKDHKIIFQKSYGHIAQNGPEVTNNTIYDIASITKILATTLATMKLVDQKKINIYDPLKKYIYNIDTTNKGDLIIKDILAHHARLLPGIGFYNKTAQSAKIMGYNAHYYSSILKDKYTIPVAKGLFMRTDYMDSMYQMIYDSRLRNTNDYRYSDLGFYLMQKVLENITGMTLDEYTYTTFYKPIGLKYTTYKPLLRYNERIIAPTENDKYFRKQLLKGNVHDSGAAMLGGVAGHAGLFSNSKEMAILMQMLLNKGSYGGKQYISPETIDLFTTRYPRSSRRGLGFDMKELAHGKSQNTSPMAPAEVFGHTGFTGTAVWADPINNIIYVFCANRTYPEGNNQTFNRREYRIKIQTLIYKALAGYIDYIYL